jgi:hypothetical protein
MSGFSIKDILARGRENGQTGSVSETCSSEVEAPEEHDASVSDAESKASTAHIELAASLSKIVGILEALAQATGSEHTLLVTMHIDGTGKMLGSHLQGEGGAQIAQSMQWKDLELENAMQIVVLAGNKLLQGKCDMVEFISELASALDRIILLKPFKIRPSHQATECDEDDDDDSELLAQQQCAKAQATPTMMNLNELKCAQLFLPDGEIDAADRRSPVKEELPPWPSNQLVGAVASTTATTEVEEHLRGGNADIEDHLNVVNEKMEQLKVQEEEEERHLLLFDHEMHQVRFLLSDFPFAFDANMDCQGPHLISMSICHHFQNCSEQISIISQSVEMSFTKQNEWVGHDSGMCGGVGHKKICRMIHKKTQKV